MHKLENNTSFADYMRHFLTAWLTAVSAEYFALSGSFKNLNTMICVENISPLWTLLITAAIMIFLCIASRYKNIKNIERWYMLILFAAYSAVSLFASFNVAYMLTCLLILTALAVFAKKGWDNTELPKPAGHSRKKFVWITAIVSILFFLALSISTVCRIYSFNAPSYDFAIFSQMFYYMKETGLPLTTIERSEVLSHMHIHVSPIFYLLLPFYYIFPFPATLQILQAGIITSAVIPMWKIAEYYGFKDWQRMLLCFLLLLFPAFSGGAYYDIHENCFLTPLILWLFYAVDRKKSLLALLISVLTLMVKEDAAMYVAVIALWLILKGALSFKKGGSKDLLMGTWILLLSLAWFAAALLYLDNKGNGVMVNRYENFAYGDMNPLAAVVETALLMPIKVLYECVKSNKLLYIAETIIPLLAMPLITRRYERYILLIPYMLINLMSSHHTQFNINFQYSFGSAAFLLYLTAANIGDMKIDRQKNKFIKISMVVSFLSYMLTIAPKEAFFPQQVIAHNSYFLNIRETIEKIPDDASVAASNSYTTFMSQRKVLYDISYIDKQILVSCDYIILSKNEEYEETYSDVIIKSGYEAADSIDNVLTIYRKQ